jgi:hypothetical protein
MNSPRSVIEKLQFSKYSSKLILHAPKDVEDFNEIEYDTSIQKEKYDLSFIFIFSIEDYSKHIKLVIEKQLITDNGYLYFAYPKKNNPKYPEYIDRDRLFSEMNPDEEGYILSSDIKFSRMISLNDVFTVVGLKSAPKKAKKTTSSKKSQCVEDYIQHIDDIKQFFINKEEVLKSYNALTPGYQKDWARYVYSAAREETQEKRLLEMEAILLEGYKSIDLYRRKKK